MPAWTKETAPKNPPRTGRRPGSKNKTGKVAIMVDAFQKRGKEYMAALEKYTGMSRPQLKLLIENGKQKNKRYLSVMELTAATLALQAAEGDAGARREIKQYIGAPARVGQQMFDDFAVFGARWWDNLNNGMTISEVVAQAYRESSIYCYCDEQLDKYRNYVKDWINDVRSAKHGEIEAEAHFTRRYLEKYVNETNRVLMEVLAEHPELIEEIGQRMEKIIEDVMGLRIVKQLAAPGG